MYRRGGLLLGRGGCGKAGNHASISGDVKLDGKPLDKGSILFAPLPGTAGVVTGGNIVDGHYEPQRRERGRPSAGIGSKSRLCERRGKWCRTRWGRRARWSRWRPARSRRVSTAAPTLKFEVKPGDNKADFDVQSK